LLLELQHVSMSRPDRIKRQPTANTTPQSTPSFDPIEPEEARQRTDDSEEVTEAVEEKREGRQKSSGGSFYPKWLHRLFLFLIIVQR
jgi:hypothetical protein